MGNSGEERRCERVDNSWPVMKGHICHHGRAPERAGLDFCALCEEQRDEREHTDSENLYESGMDPFLCHITNWSGNGKQ